MKKILFWLLAFGILVVILFVIIIGSIFKSSDDLYLYKQESDYYFKGNIVNCFSFTGYNHCLMIKVDSISIKKKAISKYYAGAYNKEKGVVAFYGRFNDDMIPRYIIVNSKTDQVSYDDAINPDSTISILDFYRKEFVDVLNKEGGYWEWF
jgi:hypothetical protein